jgi:Domain of unknown function (DUF4157)
MSRAARTRERPPPAATRLTGNPPTRTDAGGAAAPTRAPAGRRPGAEETLGQHWSLSAISIFPTPQSQAGGTAASSGGLATAARPAASSNPIGDVLRAPGQPLDPATRGLMEPRFGHDFSRVRVHADAAAAQSARAAGALAYTVGNQIVFGKDQYAPDTDPGRKLLAHELAHTVQQHDGIEAAGAQNGAVGRPDDIPERQADSAAAQIARGLGAPVGGLAARLSPAPAGVSLQRQPDPAAAKRPDPEAARWAEISRIIHEAAVRAAQQAHEKGRDKLHDRISAVPQPRQRPKPPTPTPSGLQLPPENLRPDPFAPDVPEPAVVAPVKPTDTTPSATNAAATPKKPDPGSRELQIAPGVAAQSGPTQAGEQLQVALQDKNLVPGKVIDFLRYFHLQIGILNPTLTVQLTHLRPVQSGRGSAAHPLPAADTAQLGVSISPAALKVGDLTITPQIGPAEAIAGDVLGTTKGPGRSGLHAQALGVINLQIDYKLSEGVSLTATAGGQFGRDVGPRGATGTEAATASFAATFHF